MSRRPVSTRPRGAAPDVVAGLRAFGKTIFLTTHYLEEAEFLADRIIVIAGGAIVAEGAPATLGSRDRSAARISFSLRVGVDGRRLRQIANVFPVRHLAQALLFAFDPTSHGPGIAWGQIAAVAAWGTGGLIVAVRRFRWSPANR